MHRLVLLLLPAIVAGCGSSWGLRDEDGDGKTILDGDCWDSPDGGGDVGPEASEVWYDGIDQNCDGGDDYDKDGDGFKSAAHGGDDCWDDPDVLPEEFEAINGFAALGAADVYPSAADVFYDAVDANCDGASDFDQDQDGYDTSNADYRQRDGSIGDDCYDAADVDPYPSDDVVEVELAPEEINAGATDTWYDGTDQDCDAWSDFDQDHDGFNVDAECDDLNDAIFPNPDIPEEWYDAEDENCDGNTHDKDLDGHASAAEGAGDDCWDDYEIVPEGYDALTGFAQPSSDQVFPGAVEVWYDGVDGDCGGDSDFDADGDEVTTTDWPDRDGLVGLDCDDGEASTYPGADDTWYDGIDSDCAGNSDYDLDGDGFDSEDQISTGTDCDDNRAAVNPAPTTNEVCSTSYDDNCDGSDDLQNATGCLTWYLDADDDSYGTAISQCWCEPQEATDYDVANSDDCDDGASGTNPGEDEICDAANTDEDCDGSADNNDASALSAGKTRYYHDDDTDGFGDEDHAGSLYCDDPSSSSQEWVTDNTDCDDTDTLDNPDGSETIGNGDDEDCDGGEICYDDDDDDGFLDTSADTRVSADTDCTDANEGRNTDLTTDCDDASATDYPGATETIGNGDDDDCNGGEICYDDDDNDGFLDTTADTRVSTDTDCADANEGTNTDLTTDCDDASASDYPGATETVGNGDDEDCDGGEVCYNDDDNDGFLDATGDTITSSDTDCTDAYEGTNTDLTTDCDDASATDYPGATETVGNQDDEDCDGGEICYNDDDNDGFLDATGDTITSTDTDCTDTYEGTNTDLTTDCDDASASDYPGATETVGNQDDEDCDGGEICYNDDDDDGFLDTTADTITSSDTDCIDAYEGTSSDLTTDCDDADAGDYPSATETVGNSDDEDCDGTESCYNDDDNDGYLDATGDTIASSDTDCSDAYEGTNTDLTTDCDDDSASDYPGATETVGNGDDESCDGTESCYHDDDNDGYLDSTGDTVASADTDCADAYEGTNTDLTTDCDDADAAQNPGEDELCNDVDDDCDGSADEDLTVYYTDADGDAYGTGTGDCSITSNITNATDCDDADEWVFPGAAELCDGQKNDCNDTGWTASYEDDTVSYVTTGLAWSDVTTSFDDTTAPTVTLPLTGTYYFCPGTYNAKIEVLAGSNVSLIGFYGDAATTIIDNNTASGSTVSVANATLSVEDLTITGGHGTGGTSYGGGLLADVSTVPSTPNVTLTNCVVSGNVADRGAGIAALTSAWIELDGTTIEDNTANLGGGAYLASSATLTVLTGSLVEANDAVDGGGIYAAAAGTVEIDGGSVHANIATGDGGGIRMGSGMLTLTDADVYGNTAVDGAGIWIDSGDGICDGGAIWGNTASDQGGGVYIDANTGYFAAGQSGAAACDFDGTTDNVPNDVEAYVTGSSFNTYALYTATATFFCDAGLCDPDAD